MEEKNMPKQVANIDIQEYNAAILKLETLVREYGFYGQFLEIIEVLKNMPKVVTNLEDVIAE